MSARLEIMQPFIGQARAVVPPLQHQHFRLLRIANRPDIVRSENYSNDGNIRVRKYTYTITAYAIYQRTVVEHATSIRTTSHHLPFHFFLSRRRHLFFFCACLRLARLRT